MTKRITKYVADDGTEFLRRADAEVYPALVAEIRHAMGIDPDSPAPGEIAEELLKRFTIKARG